ncbi:MAG: adenylosuccinate synthetase, partial [Croceimicrobium sp.]
MMKADVMSGFDTIKVCTKYRYKGAEIEHLPYSIDESLIEPVYEEIPGWKEDLTGLDNLEDAPKALKDYLNYVEQKIGVPISILSVGPNRTQTIELEKLPL